MHTHETATAPVVLGAPTPSGSRCNSSPIKKKGSTIMSRPTDNPKNHGCQYAWCVNEQNETPAQQSEHLSLTRYVPATASSLSRPPQNSACGEELLTVGVGARLNDDLDSGPSIFLHIYGGWRSDDTDAVLRYDEAVVLYNALGDVIDRLAPDFLLQPDRVQDFYCRGGDQ
ncbi:hypothetical protein AU189_13395 [Mycolicibacterium acapulense]|nr:hypothetical protein AU189_13395 [Mycolicibacterium acapulense]